MYEVPKNTVDYHISSSVGVSIASSSLDLTNISIRRDSNPIVISGKISVAASLLLLLVQIGGPSAFVEFISQSSLVFQVNIPYTIFVIPERKK